MAPSARPSVLPIASPNTTPRLPPARPSPLRQSTLSPPDSPLSPTDSDDSDDTAVSVAMADTYDTDFDDEAAPMLPASAGPSSRAPGGDSATRVWIPDTPVASEADKYGTEPGRGKSWFRTKLIDSPQLVLYSPALDADKPELGPTPYRAKPKPARRLSRSSWGFIAGFALAGLACFAALALASVAVMRGLQTATRLTPDASASTASALRLIIDNDALPVAVRAHALRESVHLPPQHALKDTRTIDASDEHELTIVGLHGLGGNVQYNPFPGGLDDALPNAKFVIPAGPVRHVSWNNQELPGWFDIRHLDDLYEDEDVDGFLESARQIHHLIDHERELLRRAGKQPRVAVSGFSQGAVMSMLIGLTAKHPIEGVAPLSGYMPLKRYHTLLAELASPDQAWFLYHGDQDAVLPVELAREANRMLRSDAFGMRDVEWHEHKGQVHDWTPSEMAELCEWAKDRMGSDED